MQTPHEEVTLNVELLESKMAELEIKDTLGLAEYAKVSYTSLRRAIKGERKPSALLTLKLVDALNVDFKDLLRVTRQEVETHEPLAA